MSGSKTRAVTLMLLSALSFSIMQVFVKMSSTEVGTFEQVFFRNLVSMIIAGITVYREKLDLIPEIKKGGLTLWGRSFFGFLGIVLFFYATGHARQADVAMLNRASPVFVTLFAGPILKEKISKVQVCAIGLCLVGAYISMQPPILCRCFPRWVQPWWRALPTRCCPTQSALPARRSSFSTFPCSARSARDF